MRPTLHYLFMANHLLFQKRLLSDIKCTGLTPGQPKVLDYLLYHDGAVQKDIAEFCHIEPATLTSVLLGMENKGLIERRKHGGNRRSLHVFLTETGKNFAEQIERQFSKIEAQALSGLTTEEKDSLLNLLTKVNENMHKEGNLF